MHSANYHILIVEDNDTTANNLRLFLEAEKLQVSCCGAGERALQSFQSQHFDLLLLDIMLPGMDGYELCIKIRELSQVPIIMLTARTSDEDIVKGLQCGADDYIRKPFSAVELVARVQRCLQRVHSETSTSLRVGPLALDTENRCVLVDNNSIRLTKSEFAILHLLMRQPQRIHTRDSIIQQVFGDNYQGVDRTIDTHIWSLRKKLGKRVFIQSEPGIGYRFNQQCCGE